jgi:hypothetical protein
VNRALVRGLLASAVLVFAMLITSVGTVSAATPTAQRAPASSGQFDPKAWASVKAALDASKLAKSTSLLDGVRTTKYTLADGSILSLSEPVGSRSGISPKLSVGGCGFFRLCVWLNRGDQLIVAAGSFAALTYIICFAGPIACGFALTVAAAVFQAINNRGYICPNYMIVEILFSPGTIRGCY